MSGQLSSAPASWRRDRRPLALALVAVMVGLIGLGIIHYPSGQRPAAVWSPREGLQPSGGDGESEMVQDTPSTPADDPLIQRLDTHFQRSVVMLHANQYEHALVALEQVLAIAPKMPEAYVNSGYALIGLKQYKAAAEAFLEAIDLRPEQANAYYGLAIALDALGNRVGAVGAMYSFLHRAPEGDPYRRKAAAALWEWESERDADTQTRPGLAGPIVGASEDQAVH